MPKQRIGASSNLEVAYETVAGSDLISITTLANIGKRQTQEKGVAAMNG